MYNICRIFFTFVLYSVLGFFTEITFCSLNSKKLVWNRGFLIGPWLPIYGYGALIVIFMLGGYRGDYITLFILSMFYCTLLEYLTSLVLEKVFHLRWWDYSEKKFNINGRVCLSNGFLFGLCGLLIIEVINPIISGFIDMISNPLLIFLSVILFALYMVDTFVSCYIAYEVKKNVKKINKVDATEQIKEEVAEFLKSHNTLTGRLLKSFPDLSKINGERFEKFKLTYINVKKDIANIKLSKRHK